jgi:alcohol dehydrogenase class IV
MAHQLGGFYNTPHGVANAILLTHIMKKKENTAYARLQTN